MACLLLLLICYVCWCVSFIKCHVWFVCVVNVFVCWCVRCLAGCGCVLLVCSCMSYVFAMFVIGCDDVCLFCVFCVLACVVCP